MGLAVASVGPLARLRQPLVRALGTKVGQLRSQTPPKAAARNHETTPNQNLIVLSSFSLDPSATQMALVESKLHLRQLSAGQLCPVNLFSGGS